MEIFSEIRSDNYWTSFLCVIRLKNLPDNANNVQTDRSSPSVLPKTRNNICWTSPRMFLCVETVISIIKRMSKIFRKQGRSILTRSSMDACRLPLPYAYSRYLYYTSFLIGISSLVSLYYQDYVTFLFMFLLFMSSIHFWKSPDYGHVRNIDMFLCKVIAVYFFINTLYFCDEFGRTVGFNAMSSIMIFYGIELILYSLGYKQWIVFHMSLHFYVSLFIPFILYIL